MNVTKIEEKYFDRFDYTFWEQDGKYGVIHKDGHWMIPPIYEYVRVVEADIIYLKNGDEQIITDRNGKFIRAVDFDRIKRLFWYPNKLYALHKNNKWAIAGEDFELITDYEFDSVPNLGCAPLVVKQNNQWVLVEVNERNNR